MVIWTGNIFDAENKKGCLTLQAASCKLKGTRYYSAFTVRLWNFALLSALKATVLPL